MTAHDTRGSVALALRMADRADELAMSGFFSYFDVRHKPDGSPVTSVDRRIESDLRKLITIEDPDAGVLGEEFGEEVGSGGGRWVIDPIDGTVEFIEGDPRFATLIAHEVDGRVTVGVVSAPALGMRWWAGAGMGSYVRREDAVSAARVSIVADPTRARALVPGEVLRRDAAGPARDATVRLMDAGTTLVPFGPSWQAIRVAAGDYDAAIARGRWWDVAPLSIVVTEAGGAVTHARGDDGLWTAVVTNRQLAAVPNERHAVPSS